VKNVTKPIYIVTLLMLTLLTIATGVQAQDKEAHKVVIQVSQPDPAEHKIVLNMAFKGREKITIPSCLSFRPASVLRQGLHRATMRPLPRLESGPKSGAILGHLFFAAALTFRSCTAWTTSRSTSSPLPGPRDSHSRERGSRAGEKHGLAGCALQCLRQYHGQDRAQTGHAT